MQRSIIDKLKTYVADRDNYPVLNPDAVTLQNEILKPDPDLAAVRKLIRADPTLTSEVLKVANSPYYKGLEEVSTIKEAALRLGQNEVFNMIMQVIHKQNFSSKVPMIRSFQNRLWDHSVACGFASLWLVRHLKLGDLLHKAFIAGLLHDMGKLFLLSAVEALMAEEKNAARLTPDTVAKILDSLHDKQGYELLTRWNLPRHYCCIARDHHAEEYDEADHLLLVVRLANMVCDKMARKDPEDDFTYIMGSREADILGVKETGIALLEIAMEDAGFTDLVTIKSRP